MIGTQGIGTRGREKEITATGIDALACSALPAKPWTVFCGTHLLPNGKTRRIHECAGSGGLRTTRMCETNAVLGTTGVRLRSPVLFPD